MPYHTQNPHPHSRRAFLMRGAFAAGALAAGSRTTSSEPEPQHAGDDLDRWIEQEMQAEHVPGLSVCSIRDGQVAWTRAYGWANVDAKAAMTPDTIQNIASISKTVTATAVMQLWQQGRFGLDDDVAGPVGFPVRNPHYPDAPITIRHLLTHTASIKDGPAYDLSYTAGDPTVPLAEWVREYLTPGGRFYKESGNFYKHRPGEKHVYSNVGFGLLGYLVEAVSGTPFNTYCKQHLFEPLGMTATGWFLSEVDPAQHAIPYRYIPAKRAQRMKRPPALVERVPKDGGFAPYQLYSFPNYPDGLVRTSVRAFAHFLLANLNGGKYKNAALLEPATLAEIFRIQFDRSDEPGHWQGLAWVGLKDAQGRTLWLHSGSDPGVATIAILRPDDRAGVAAFANADSALPGKLAQRLLDIAPGAA